MNQKVVGFGKIQTMPHYLERQNRTEFGVINVKYRHEADQGEHETERRSGAGTGSATENASMWNGVLFVRPENMREKFEPFHKYFKDISVKPRVEALVGDEMSQLGKRFADGIVKADIIVAFVPAIADFGKGTVDLLHLIKAVQAAKLDVKVIAVTEDVELAAAMARKFTFDLHSVIEMGPTAVKDVERAVAALRGAK
jgi:hypothetical protein